MKKDNVRKSDMLNWDHLDNTEIYYFDHSPSEYFEAILSSHLLQVYEIEIEDNKDEEGKGTGEIGAIINTRFIKNLDNNKDNSMYSFCCVYDDRSPVRVSFVHGVRLILIDAKKKDKNISMEILEMIKENIRAGKEGA